MGFQQEDFVYHDLFRENTFLKDVLHSLCDSQHVGTIESDLAQFSKRASSTILDLMWKAESHPPQHRAFDHWGQRVDEIIVDDAWNEMHNIAASEELISIGYLRKSAEASRLHQFLKLLIFHPSSAFYTCPLAMTDGAARVLELENGPLKESFFHKLLADRGDDFWTAGQWMTEKAGGSDVSQSETVAKQEGGVYRLYGTKWFTSAVTANLAMALAQTPVDGRNRLSLFLIPIRDGNGKLNNIEVLRLKDKLGTKAMPTAELELKGVEGFLVGELGAGVKNIATVLNISRLYNSVCATGTILRLHSLIRDYSQKRKAFGKMLIEHPLHQQTLLKSQSEVHACVLFVSEMALLLGKSEMTTASDSEAAALRLLTPVAKLWTAKKAVNITSELVEAFGGAGYIEDTQLPRFLRDAQVFSIWEGTTNIMSLDTLRAVASERVFIGAFDYLSGLSTDISPSPELDKMKKLMEDCKDGWLQSLNSPNDREVAARMLAFALGDCFCGLLLLRFAQSTQKARDLHLAQVFIRNRDHVDFENLERDSERNQKTLLS